jgi:hypothetical protein
VNLESICPWDSHLTSVCSTSCVPAASMAEYSSEYNLDYNGLLLM